MNPEVLRGLGELKTARIQHAAVESRPLFHGIEPGRVSPASLA